MSFSIDRRRMIQILAGGAAGVAASPLPWKLLDDISIWTQNPPWAAELPRGPVEERFSHCALCPAGCGIRVRTVRGIPFSISPVPDHPLSNGRLCALGLCGHHLLVHPRRLRGARTRDLGGDRPRDIPGKLGADRLARWIEEERRSGGTVAILDTRPGTADSAIYRECVGGLPGGVYVPLHGEAAPIALVDALRSRTTAPCWFDVPARNRALCFGGDPTDGWGSASSHVSLEGGGALIVASGEAPPPSPVREAIRIEPGTAAELARGISRTLIEEGLIARLPSLPAIAAGLPTRETAAARCGIASSAILELSRHLARHPSSILPMGATCSPGNPDALRAVTGLCLLIAGDRESGGIRTGDGARPRWPDELTGEKTPDTRYEEVEEGALDLLIVDDRYSRHMPRPDQLRRMMRNPFRSRIARLSAFRCEDDPSWDLLLEAPGYHERLDEILSPVNRKERFYALSAPLQSPIARRRSPANPVTLAFAMERRRRPGDIEPLPERESVLEARVEAIFAGGSGTVFTPGSPRCDVTQVSRISSPGELMSLLSSGSIWSQEGSGEAAPGDPMDLALDLLQNTGPADDPAASGTPGPRHLTAIPDLPAVMGKLYCESDLEPRRRT